MMLSAVRKAARAAITPFHSLPNPRTETARRLIGGGLLALAVCGLALAGLLLSSSPPLAQAQANNVDYDVDNDGLIEVANLAQLNAIRWDLDGDGTPSSGNVASYTSAFPGAVSGMGCPGSICQGYELTADLDFDTNGNGEADAGDAYWNGGAGWDPLGWQTGPDSLPYTAVFNGNGHTVTNLFINRTGTGNFAFGLFGRVEAARISHVGVVNANVSADSFAGALVGQLEFSTSGSTVISSSIHASFATGSVSGTGATGGLVGAVGSSKIAASWANVDVSTTSFSSGVGGLAGGATGAATEVAASYSLGNVSGPVGSTNVGGFVGSVANDAVVEGYFNADTATGTTYTDGGRGRTTAQLQSPTGYTGIYADWNVDVDGNGIADAPWDFGTGSDYPILKADRNGDGVYTSGEFGGQTGRIDYDGDDDGLIEVSSLAQLNAIRWDLNGDGTPDAANAAEYRAVFPNAASGMGCLSDDCKGYELIANLDFDTNGDGRTDVPGDAYWNGGFGWEPIGSDSAPAELKFDGNYMTISNLYIQRATQNRVGLFGRLNAEGGSPQSGHIVRVGIVGANVSGFIDVGALVGFNAGSNALVGRSHATGKVTGAGSQAGGLVGSTQGRVEHSWADVDVRAVAPSGNAINVGGLVGNANAVSYSYSIGAVAG